MPTVEEAILTAIEFENRVRDTYRGAEKAAKDDTGRRVFKLLGDEEQGHIDYLNSRLVQWRKDGILTVESMDSIVPPMDIIEERQKDLQSRLEGEDRGDEIKMLQKAHQLEIQTSTFYKEMVEAMDAEARKMFARFVEIEEGHVAVVRAEIDALSGTGYFFDFAEFNMEG
jgi:rubrerythrin